MEEGKTEGTCWDLVISMSFCLEGICGKEKLMQENLTERMP